MRHHTLNEGDVCVVLSLLCTRQQRLIKRRQKVLLPTCESVCEKPSVLPFCLARITLRQEKGAVRGVR